MASAVKVILDDQQAIRMSSHRFSFGLACLDSSG
jgi:hypothetical protein